LENTNLSLTVNGNFVAVNIYGEGKNIVSIQYDGKELPSAVIPSDIGNLKKIEIKLGKQEIPYLTKASAKVYSPEYIVDNKSLSFTLGSFKDHKVEFELISPDEVESIKINNIPTENFDVIREKGINKIKVHTISQTGEDEFFIINFEIYIIDCFCLAVIYFREIFKFYFCLFLSKHHYCSHASDSENKANQTKRYRFCFNQDVFLPKQHIYYFV